ncbi:MAG TPA: CBS domain-containing protein [Acidimicrobiales bacterium]|nr:CBS domain-containing protein [Acidimicrobiales bacterium]
MTKAREIMTKGTEFAKMEESIAEAAKRMAKSDVGVLPICNDQKRLQGMLTDRDIVVKVIAQGKDPQKTKVSDVAQGTEVVTIGADDSIEEALRTMKDHKVRRLPVVDGSEVVGMVSQGDIATSLPNERVGDLVEAISAAP